MIILLLAMLQAPQEDAAATEALAAFETGWQQKKDSSSRVSLVGTLARTHHEKVVGKLGSLLTTEDKAVRVAAAQGMAGYQSAPPELKKSAAHALASALTAGANVRDPEVEQALFGAIGSLQEESSASALKSHFEDKEPRIAGAAVTAAGSLKSKTLIEPLIELLRECEKTARPPAPSPSPSGKSTKVPKGKGSSGGGGSSPQPDPEAARRDRASNLLPTIQGALQSLTAQNLSGADEWEKWWSKNRSTFTVPK
jgi:HEAT repeat protein